MGCICVGGGVACDGWWSCVCIAYVYLEREREVERPAPDVVMRERARDERTPERLLICWVGRCGDSFVELKDFWVAFGRFDSVRDKGAVGWLESDFSWRAQSIAIQPASLKLTIYILSHKSLVT